MSNKCNDRVVEETVAETGESKALVEHVINFQLNFIGRKIEEGSFESVRVPNFGVFRAKLKSVQWNHYMRSMNENYRKIIRKR